MLDLVPPCFDTYSTVHAVPLDANGVIHTSPGHAPWVTWPRNRLQAEGLPHQCGLSTLRSDLLPSISIAPIAIDLKELLDNWCPHALLGLKGRIETSPIGYRLARGVFWSLTGSITSRGLGLLSGIFVAHVPGKEDFGQLGMIQNTVGMFGVFAGLGLGLTANKHVAEYK